MSVKSQRPLIDSFKEERVPLNSRKYGFERLLRVFFNFWNASIGQAQKIANSFQIDFVFFLAKTSKN
jgi:hypothetical protein